MKLPMPFLAGLLAASALLPVPSVLAQGATPPAVRLPLPPVADEAQPSAFVTAARSAIAAGRIGEAMEAIERAESRVLIRSVRPSRAGSPSDQILVRMLAQARAALAQGDRASAVETLAEVAGHPALDSQVE